ncbi:response regulator [Anaerolinea thermophila]|uniref:NarL family two-component system response regulator n=1 Tax=Anaerolinea thermophila (strain DSM 14523 / JCM 11388 / NBRC 100420 / UNI-1) TaxID=926569 RepID=E8N5N0_ANATU|nr:response regulator [Anaerolinea thermophila]BAJ63744.1 putative NarL family two-component system response regulator [Anaerolinea thermophila UNI-1]
MKPFRVLLADDHEVVRAGIRRVLEEIENIQVVAEVGDGKTLQQEIARQLPDLILIDVTMPDFDPISAIHSIRLNYPTLKILVVSAYDDNVYVQGLLSAGVHGYHLKDQPLNDLKLAVQRVLSGDHWISSPLIGKLVHALSNSSIPGLTPRQQEILLYLWEGKDNQQIARLTGLSVKTIENHLTRLYRLLNVQSRLEAVNYLNQHPELLGQHNPTSHNSPEHSSKSDFPVAVLIVDDNPRFRQQLAHVMGKINNHLSVYESGDITSAVLISQKIKPLVAFIDVVLRGDENGIQCTRRIRAVSPQTRVVLISAYPDREFHRLGMEAGAVAFIDKKDLDVKTLRTILEDCISTTTSSS